MATSLKIDSLAKSIDKNRPNLTGTTDGTGDVYIFNGSTNLGKATVAPDGTWAFTVPASLKDGTARFTAKELDKAKFVNPSNLVEFVLDTKPPAIPTVDAIKLPTKETTQILTGKVEKGATVEVFDGITSLGQAIVNAQGAWTLALGLTTDGTYNITAKATDVAGNTSAASKVVILTVDTTPPAAPTLNPPADAISKVATQKLSGTAEPGSKVQIYSNGVPLLAKEIIADKNGNWTVSLKLASHPHELTVTAKDAAGNESDPSDVKKLTIDTNAPTLISVDAPTASATPVNTLPSLSGRVDADAITVEVYAGSVLLGRVESADISAGEWTLDPADFFPVTLKDGVQKITAKAIDVAGNVSKASAPQNYTIDNKPPAIPTVDAIKLPTQNETPTLTGKAEKYADVEVFAGTTSLGTVKADAKGVWSLTVDVVNKLLDGTHSITAKATDAAGNKNDTASKAVMLTVDTTAPVATLNLAKTIDKVATQKLTGTTEAGAKVQIYGGADGTKQLLAKEVVADKNGNWTASVKLDDAEHQLSIKATDAAGNTFTTPPPAQTLTIDTKAPVAPTLDAIAPSGQALPATLSGNLGGIVDADTWVMVYAGSTELGRVKATGGAWTVDISNAPLIKVGAQKITAKATDAAGNVSKASTPRDFKIEAVTPPKTVVISDGSSSILGVNDTLLFKNIATDTTIANYAVATNSIQLSKAVYTALGGVGALSADEFVAGIAAATAEHRIIYDSATGKLSYDADGNGAGAAILIGAFTNTPALGVAEFTIV